MTVSSYFKFAGRRFHPLSYGTFRLKYTPTFVGKSSTLERREGYTSSNIAYIQHGFTNAPPPVPVGFAPRGADETEPNLKAPIEVTGHGIPSPVKQIRIPPRGIGESGFGHG